MRSLILLTFVVSGCALAAAFGFSDDERRANACCQCLVETACTDLAVDTCVSTLNTPREEEGGVPWRHHSLLGGEGDAHACAAQAVFTDFDEKRGGCGNVCGAFAESALPANGG